MKSLLPVGTIGHLAFTVYRLVASKHVRLICGICFLRNIHKKYVVYVSRSCSVLNSLIISSGGGHIPENKRLLKSI